MVGVAVNVTGVPSHTAPAGEAAMLTLTGISGLTVTSITFDVAGLPVAHAMFEVSKQLTSSPFDRDPLV
ncbi:hypothetical protein DSECCO2_433470 [anaerobic digester metagenome]